MNSSEIRGTLDASLSSSPENLISASDYKEAIISQLTPILQRRFPNDFQKRQIRPHRNRISCACPYCGDSHKSSHKKRGNFILEGKQRNYYKCWNCGIFKRTDEFFKDHNVTLDLSVIDYIVKTKQDFSTGFGSSAKYDFSILMDEEPIDKYAFDREAFKKALKLVEVKGSPVESWLRRRLQFQNERFLYSPMKNYIAILNLTPSGKILGIQKRNLKVDQYHEKYLTYKLSKLYQGFFPNEEVPEEIDCLSEIFGILQLDFNKPITLFEGPFDSFLFKNSIASAGAHKNLPIEISVRYFCDDDETGIKKAIKYIEQGEYVFLWSKLKRDINLPYRKKWDLNDLLIWAKENNVNIPRLENYFSNDTFDLMEL